MMKKNEDDEVFSPPRGGLVVASYNIHGCVGTDGQFLPARVANVMNEMGVDVIGLQEVSWNRGNERNAHQLNQLAQSLRLHAVAGPTLEKPDGYYGNALLTNREVLEIRRLDLSLPNLEPRGALDVDMNLGGQTLRVIVTHLGLRASERRRQVKCLLAALCQERTRYRGTILLGDVNEWFPIGRPLRWLRRHFRSSAVLRTYPSWMPVFALDRIWVRPQEMLLEIAVHKTPLSMAASDHLPVKALLSYDSR